MQVQNHETWLKQFENHGKFKIKNYTFYDFEPFYWTKKIFENFFWFFFLKYFFWIFFCRNIVDEQFARLCRRPAVIISRIFHCPHRWSALTKTMALNITTRPEICIKQTTSKIMMEAMFEQKTAQKYIFFLYFYFFGKTIIKISLSFIKQNSKSFIHISSWSLPYCYFFCSILHFSAIHSF